MLTVLCVCRRRGLLDRSTAPRGLVPCTVPTPSHTNLRYLSLSLSRSLSLSSSWVDIKYMLGSCLHTQIGLSAQTGIMDMGPHGRAPQRIYGVPPE